MTIEQVTYQIYAWLKSHQIEPDDVTMIIRARDVQTLAQIEETILREISGRIPPSATPINLRSLKLNGLTISVSTIDESREPAASK